VSELIARFESSSRSSTPERSLTPDRAQSAAGRPPVEAPRPAFGIETGRSTGAIPKKQAFGPVPTVHKSDANPVGPVTGLASSAVIAAAAQSVTAGGSDRNSAGDGQLASGDNNLDSRPAEFEAAAGEEESDASRRRAELKGLKEFAQKYLSDNNNAASGQPASSGPHKPVGHHLVRPEAAAQPAEPAASEPGPAAAADSPADGDSGEVRGAEALAADSDTEDLDSMPPTIRDVENGQYSPPTAPPSSAK
jgi:hypothetical protein